MFSVTLSMAGGLIAGKEGPFIHAGGIVGGGWASMGSRYGSFSMMDNRLACFDGLCLSLYTLGAIIAVLLLV